MYFVKVTVTIYGTKMVEFVGKRGIRSFHSVNDKTGWQTDNGLFFVKPRKLEGWKTLKAAEQYISKEMENDKLREHIHGYEKRFDIITVQ